MNGNPQFRPVFMAEILPQFRDTRVFRLLNDLPFFHVRARALFLAFEKFTRSYLFQIALEIM